MITRIKTGSREEWKELRRHYIGGSDAAAVIGMNPFSSPYALWAEKTGKVPGFEGNLCTEVGSYLEEFVARKWGDYQDKAVQRCNFSMVNDLYPFAIANIDRKVIGENAGLECKTCSALSTKRFKNGEYPENYYCQCMHYLAVTGWDRWYLGVLIGNSDFKCFVIERDEEEIAALMLAEEEFWKHVTEDTPPDADGSDATAEIIAALYPESSGGEIELFGIESLFEERRSLDGQIKELEALKDGIDNRLKAELGENESGVCGLYKVVWKNAKRSSFDAKRYAAEHPGEDLSPYYKTSEYRTFKVSERKEK